MERQRRQAGTLSGGEQQMLAITGDEVVENIARLAVDETMGEMESEMQCNHRTPARLAFADHMNRFIAGDRAPSSPEGAKMLIRSRNLIDTGIGEASTWAVAQDL